MFPILYGISSNGKLKEWKISLETNNKESKIIICYGFVDMKKTTSIKTISLGKNIGKINSTTHYEQALNEATSKFTKKKNSGYIEEYEKLNIKLDVPSKIFPMLAHDFNKRGKDIEFPAYVQPKLDGVRCIYNGFTKEFTSRTAKLYPYNNFNHIRNELGTGNFILDGELYSHEIPFEDLVGLVRKTNTNPNDPSLKKVTFIVYDIIILDTPYLDRLKTLESIINPFWLYTKLITTEFIQSKKELYHFHKIYTDKGYEGIIIRNINGLYVPNYRSKDLQKFKKFKDEEFKIVDFTEGTSSESGAIIFIVESKNKTKTRFSVRPAFTFENRKKMFSKGKSFIGKFLTVKFFELTNNGIPRFPVGVSIRDYE